MPPFNIFEWTSQELRTWLLANGETITCPSDFALIKEGDCLPTLVVLLEGRLVVTTSNQQQRQERVANLTPGSLVGEMSWLEQRPAVATVITSGECTILRFTPQTLELLAKDQPGMTAQLHRLIAQKLAVQIQGQNAWIHRLQGDRVPYEALRKVLTLFANLEEQDVFKLARIGRIQRLQPETLLINQGDKVPAIHLLLSGEAEILFTLDGRTAVVGTSRRGELLGEMSLLLNDQQGAAASVRSERGMDLLTIEHNSLLAEMERNPALKSRFYRGLACMLSRRSREQLQSQRRALVSQMVEQESILPLDVDQLGAITRAARHFDWLCRHFQSGEPAIP